MGFWRLDFIVKGCLDRSYTHFGHDFSLGGANQMDYVFIYIKTSRKHLLPGRQSRVSYLFSFYYYIGISVTKWP